MNTNMTPNEMSSVKKKKRMNIFDFFMIFIVILLIGLIVFWSTPWSQGLKDKMTKNVSLQYTVEIQNVNQKFLNKIKEGDAVIDSVSKNEIGTVLAIETKEHQELTLGENGQGVMEKSELYDLIITISSTAGETEKGYSIHSCRIAVGEGIQLRFPDFVCEGYCIGLNVVE